MAFNIHETAPPAHTARFWARRRREHYFCTGTSKNSNETEKKQSAQHDFRLDRSVLFLAVETLGCCTYKNAT